jgi:hypothetical protein
MSLMTVRGMNCIPQAEQAENAEEIVSTMWLKWRWLWPAIMTCAATENG